MCRCIFIALAVMVLMTVASAGCLENIKIAPSEVQNHGNIIAIDSDYVDASTIIALLLDPSTYQPGLFKAIDKYLPRDKPVVEIGVGLGVVMADISKKLNVPKQHVVLTPNPYMLPLLEKTIQANSLPIRLEHATIAYDSGDYVEVIYPVSMKIQANKVLNEESETRVMVPVTTVCDVISMANFTNQEDVTLVVETPDLIRIIFEKEPRIYNNVSLIIATTTASTNLELSQLLNKALTTGYSPIMITDANTEHNRALVFKR